MEKLNIILSDGIEKEVDCIFYLYNSKYYFIYTEKEIDENGYVILYLVQVGKEIKNTETGPLETGYMVGVEINDDAEWKSVQTSISKIVEDAKNGTTNPEIQYLPLNMLSKLKIVSKKMFRLMKDIVVNNLKVDLGIQQVNELVTPEPLAPITPVEPVEPVTSEQALQLGVPDVASPTHLSNLSEPSIFNNTESVNAFDSQTTLANNMVEEDNTVIIDYRTKYFEEQEKNNQLQNQIDELNRKIQEIKNILN